MRTTWRRLSFLILLSLLLVGSLACAQGETGEAPEVRAPARPASLPSAAAPAPTQPAQAAPLVVFLGDSLTAGYGLDGDQAYPALLERRLAEKGTPVRVINAGVSGDTTAGGLARLDWLLRQKPDVLVVGLGGNDGLRGANPDQIESNLREIVRRAKAAGVRVLLLGMRIPPNYGPEYTRRFEAMYPQIAKELDVPLVPFLLEGVGGIARLNQADAIHPTAEGQEIVADNVEPYLREMLETPAAAAAR
jgi:acyl-CoA thioesterase I